MRAKLPMIFVVLLALMVALAGCGGADGKENIIASNEGEVVSATNENDIEDTEDLIREEESNVPEVEGLDMIFPIYPGAVRVEFAKVFDTRWEVFYKSSASWETVIDFYIDKIGTIESMDHGEDVPYEAAEGEYFFREIPNDDSAFFMILEDQGSSTLIKVLATEDYFH